MSSYIYLTGMYELRNSSGYYTAPLGKNINEFTWKNYNNSMELNNHLLTELKFNLSDVNLMGTENSYKYMPENMNRIQVRFDYDLMMNDAFGQCRESPECTFNSVLNIKKSKVFSDLSGYL